MPRLAPVTALGCHHPATKVAECHVHGIRRFRRYPLSHARFAARSRSLEPVDLALKLRYLISQAFLAPDHFLRHPAQSLI